jgi:hypothetical protein
MDMIGLPVDDEIRYRRFEQIYHDVCSTCHDFKPGCIILECPKLRST